MLLFLLGPVVLAIDVADMMAAIAVGVGLQESWTTAGARALYQPRCHFVDRAHILTVNGSGFESKRSGAAENGSRRCLRKMRVLVVHVVFADVDYRQLPQLR